VSSALGIALILAQFPLAFWLGWTLRWSFFLRQTRKSASRNEVHDSSQWKENVRRAQLKNNELN
jgi:hypothetical protein